MIPLEERERRIRQLEEMAATAESFPLTVVIGDRTVVFQSRDVLETTLADAMRNCARDGLRAIREPNGKMWLVPVTTVDPMKDRGPGRRPWLPRQQGWLRRVL